MAIKSHNGRLGEFEYDDTQFSIADEERSSLIYIGEETDGSKIEIPRGVVDLTNTFASSNITSPPRIPYGVKVMKSTFVNTEITEMPDIPDTVKILDGAFAMTKVHRIKPLPKGVESMEDIFLDCEAVQEMMIQSKKEPETAVLKVRPKHKLLCPKHRIGSYILPQVKAVAKA